MNATLIPNEKNKNNECIKLFIQTMHKEKCSFEKERSNNEKRAIQELGTKYGSRFVYIVNEYKEKWNLQNRLNER